MNSQSTTFRSRIAREREVHLEKNYRQIGIPAVAAASNPSCKTADRKMAEERERRLPQTQHFGSSATD